MMMTDVIITRNPHRADVGGLNRYCRRAAQSSPSRSVVTSLHQERGDVPNRLHGRIAPARNTVNWVIRLHDFLSILRTSVVAVGAEYIWIHLINVPAGYDLREHSPYLGGIDYPLRTQRLRRRRSFSVL
ncbi:hypothetical protein EVAR_29193_1 [Eumeta japonica]|uniref:Uncharacterized protein n=1 Tax=Eumeta variegata TaxID=151549 RepID=A0A4C1VCN5_EUMVA|nr:hypothetical protein EVAR_29193_1 [Eumeta japonica]